MKLDNKEKIKLIITMGFIILSFIVVLTAMIVYNVYGERKMPFIIDKILIVSSADGKNKSTDDSKWDIDINQYNDIYIKISKNDMFKKTDFLKSIKIENITLENFDDNKIKLYMPNSGNDNSLFIYDDMYVFENKLTYQAGATDNPKTLKIGNQGGTLVFRIAKTKIFNYVSESKESINYNGLLLKNANISSEKLKCNITFDLVIETSLAKYKATLKYSLPVGKIEDDGVSKFYDENFDKIIFKRI